jgi:hypothetical protein
VDVFELRVVRVTAADGVEKTNGSVPPLGDASKSNPSVQEHLGGTYNAIVKRSTAAFCIMNHVERAQLPIQESSVAAPFSLEFEREAPGEV